MKKIMLLLLMCLCTGAIANDGQSVMIYRYWDWGKTPKRDDYQIAALRLALEKTRSQYGDFTIIRHVESFSTSRVRREVNRGEIVNIHAGPWRPLETDPAKLSERSLRVEVPLFNGVLGYRQLIIRKNDAPIFKNIKTEKDLKELIVGQARGWQDVDIYRYNGYKVDDAANLMSLFAMLNSKRFDYLAMSIAEAKSALSVDAEQNQGFMIAPNIIIYYPFPIIFYVSIKEPKMAERLRLGLLAAEKDGTLHQLFIQYFSDDIATLKKQKPRCFVLKNPFIPEHLNQPKPLLLEEDISEK